MKKVIRLSFGFGLTFSEEQHNKSCLKDKRIPSGTRIFLVCKMFNSGGTEQKKYRTSKVFENNAEGAIEARHEAQIEYYSTMVAYGKQNVSLIDTLSYEK